MSVGEILNNTFSLLREQLKTYMGLVAISIGVTIMGIIFAVLCMLLGSYGAIIGLAVVLILDCVVNIILYAALTKTASEQIIGEKISIGEAWRFATGKTWPLLVSALLVAILGSIGLILLIIPGIYIFVSFALIFQTIIIEGYGPGDALSRSHALVKGSWWRCFGVLLMVFIIEYALISLVSGLLSLFISTGSLGNLLDEPIRWSVSLLFVPIGVIATTLLFYDLRDRKNNLESPSVADSLTENNNSTVSE
jgi:hypothetical protein